MKTIVIWDECEANIKFFVLEGNYSHLNGVYINSVLSKEKHQDELSKLVYCQDTGEIKLPILKEFPIKLLAQREMFCIVVAGCVP